MKLVAKSVKDLKEFEAISLIHNKSEKCASETRGILGDIIKGAVEQADS